MPREQAPTTPEPKPQSQAPLPTISVVVPNYNNGSTLGRALQSLVDQNYPGLEVMVVDGGSTDNSLEVIKQFEPHLTWWVSEQDSGQANAINKGFARCTGEVVNWLCSDDVLLPGALQAVGRWFGQDPGLGVLAGASDGDSWIKGRRCQYTMRVTQEQIDLMPCDNPIPQPACFYRRSLLNRSPPLDENYHYTMDFELWMYLKSQGAKWRCVDQALALMVEAGDNKTRSGGAKIAVEFERVYKAYAKEWIPMTFWNRLRIPLFLFLRRHPGRFWRWMIRPVQVSITAGLAPFYGLERLRAMDWVRWYDEA